MKVLLIDDNEVDRMAVVRALEGSPVALRVTSTLAEGLELVQAERFDCAIVDLQSALGTALDFLAATESSQLATIVLTGAGDEKSAIEALRRGAQDYLHKRELTAELLVRALGYARERKTAIQEIENQNRRLQEANAELRDVARRDPLTGVLNRRGLAEIVEREAQRTHRTGGNMAVLLIDCDDFKSINDVHGHCVGDDVLRAVAHVLEKTVRPTDHVARVGGDEFLILLGDIRPAEAVAVAERIQYGIRVQRIASSDGAVEPSCSIGCCPLEGDEHSLDAILRRAQRSLKQSKVLGKDTVSTHRAAPYPGQHELSEVLERLTDGSGLRVVGQPIVRLQDRAVVGYELCTRGPAGEYQSPEDFLQLALTADRATDVDMACLRVVGDVCQAIVAQPEARVHVNVSPTTLIELGSDTVLEVLREIQKRSRRTVCVELSERRFVGPPADCVELTERLESEGMLLALDEVRLSRGGLEALLLLEPDFLKVDRRLLVGSCDDSSRRQTLHRLVALTARRPMQSVAVGIEGEAHVQVARELGFELGQGYYLGDIQPVS